MFFVSLLIGQNTAYKFDYYDISNGLSQNQAYVIYQTSDGYIYVGSQGGLDRFDGYNFKYYSHDPSDSTTIPYGWVNSIGQDADGQAYNINADTAAGALAGALLAEKTIYLSDVPGLLIDKDDPTSIISSIQYKQLYEMFETGVISDGMIPKVESCIQALEKGAKAAHLLDGRVSHVLLLEIFTDSGIGTMIKKGEEDV